MSFLALDRARERQQQALDRAFGSTVTLGGTSYPAAVLVGRVEPVPKEDGSGWERVQDITAVVRKSRLPTEPVTKVQVGYGGVPYLIESVGGQNAGEVSWIIKGRRRMS